MSHTTAIAQQGQGPTDTPVFQSPTLYPAGGTPTSTFQNLTLLDQRLVSTEEGFTLASNQQQYHKIRTENSHDNQIDILGRGDHVTTAVQHVACFTALLKCPTSEAEVSTQQPVHAKLGHKPHTSTILHCSVAELILSLPPMPTKQ